MFLEMAEERQQSRVGLGGRNDPCFIAVRLLLFYKDIFERKKSVEIKITGLKDQF